MPHSALDRTVTKVIDTMQDHGWTTHLVVPPDPEFPHLDTPEGCADVAYVGGLLVVPHDDGSHTEVTFTAALAINEDSGRVVWLRDEGRGDAPFVLEAGNRFWRPKRNRIADWERAVSDTCAWIGLDPNTGEFG